MKESGKKPPDVFNVMFCDSLIICITQQTNLYVAQQGKEHVNVREKEIATVIAILLPSGYCRVPNVTPTELLLRALTMKLLQEP